MADQIEYTESSSNVFADLDLPDADELQFKSLLTIQIRLLIEQEQHTPSEAATRMGLSETELSGLLRGRFDGFPAERLFKCLNRLGRRVEIRISPQETDPDNARTLLVAA